MKKYRGTIILALMVAGLVYYSYNEYQGMDQAKQQLEEKSQIQSEIKKDSVEKLVISKPNQKIELIKEGAAWVLLSPHRDLADETAVDTFIDSLLKEKGQKLSPSEGDIDWQSYGLDEALITIAVESEKNQSLTYDLSQKLSYDNKRFVRLKRDKNALYVAESNWANYLNKSPEDFINKDLLANNFEVSEFTIKSKKQNMHFAQKSEWVFAKDESIKIDQDAVKGFLNDLKSIKATGVAVFQKEPKDLKSLGLSQPEVTIELKNSDRQLNLQFYKNKAEWYFINSERVDIFKIAGYNVDKINKKLIDFRDRSFPFQFELGTAKQVTLSDSGKSQALEQNAGQWTYAGDKKSKPVDQIKVDGMFRDIRSLKAEEFLARQKFKVDGSVKIESGKEAKASQPIFLMEWGETLTRPEAKTLVKIKTNLSDEVILIEKSALEKISGAQFEKLENEAPAAANDLKDQK